MITNDSVEPRGASAPMPVTDFQRDVYCLLGLPFDALTLVQAEAALLQAVRTRQRCFLSTPNLNFLISALTDTPFRDSVLRSDLSVADGMPIVWLARAFGVPITERVAGSTLFELLRTQVAIPVSVFFFGGPDGVAQRAHEALNAGASAGMRSVGFHSPGFGTLADMSSAAVMAQINDSGADFLIVALGAKRGQTWIEHNLSRLRTPLVSHLGAVVNFVAGTVTRAPSRLGGLGLEWLWRIKEEPALWRRYASDGATFLRLLLTRVLPGALAARRQRARRGPPLAVSVSRAGDSATLTLSGACCQPALQALRDGLTTVTSQAGDITVALGGIDAIDHAAIGLLMLLYGHQSKLGRGLALTAVGPALRHTLSLNCADYLLAPLAARPAIQPAAAVLSD